MAQRLKAFLRENRWIDRRSLRSQVTQRGPWCGGFGAGSCWSRSFCCIEVATILGMTRVVALSFAHCVSLIDRTDHLLSTLPL